MNSILCKTFIMTAVATLASSAQVTTAVSTMPPLKADIELERTTRSPDGKVHAQNASGRFYRDQERRTRLEWGNQVTIFDPVAQRIIALRLKQKTARVTSLTSQPKDRRVLGTLSGVSPSDSEVSETGMPVSSDLGTKIIEGYEVVGKEYISNFPATSEDGNRVSIRGTSQMWYAPALTIPLLTTSNDPLGGVATIAYRNLEVGTNPDLLLFSIPDGFAVIHSTWEPRTTAAPAVKNPLLPQK